MEEKQYRMYLAGKIIRVVLLIFLCESCLCITKDNEFCLEDDTVIHRILDLSYVQCQEECGKRRHCKAINYRRLFNLCELLGTDKGSKGTSVPRKKACLFLKKTDMLDTILKGCNCSEGLTCDTNAKTCAVTECSKITLTNGQLFGNMYSDGSRVKFICNPGYVKATNEFNSICEASGQWSSQPNCFKDCGTVPSVANAQVISGGGLTIEGAVVRYQCLPGFTFNGNPSNLTCTADGTWFDQASVVCVPVKGIGDPCVSHSDCTLTDGVCVGGICFCSPLNRYKPEINDCFQVCTSFTDTFTTFANTAVKGYNDIGVSYPITDAKQCEDLCRTDPQCLSFEVWENWDYDHFTSTWIYKGLLCNRASIAYLNILDADPNSISNSYSISNRDCI